MQEVYACDSVCTKHAKNMTSFPAELTVLRAFLFAGKKQ